MRCQRLRNGPVFSGSSVSKVPTGIDDISSKMLLNQFDLAANPKTGGSELSKMV
jgi:hypothetical protein